jgi:hypothetical protein
MASASAIAAPEKIMSKTKSEDFMAELLNQLSRYLGIAAISQKFPNVNF